MDIVLSCVSVDLILTSGSCSCFSKIWSVEVCGASSANNDNNNGWHTPFVITNSLRSG